MSESRDGVLVYLDAVAASDWRAGVDWLTAAERARLAQLRRAEDAEAFAAGRVFLRRVLGAHLRLAPAAVRLEPDEAGRKPRLAGHPSVDFSLSRAGDRHVVAVATGGPRVGADLEAWRGPRAARALEPLPLAETLSPAEDGAFKSVPEPERARAFVGVWARKEAIAKATGQGIGRLPPATFTVGVTALPRHAGGPPAGELPAVPAPIGVPGAWSLHAVELDGEGLTLAVAVLGPGAFCRFA